MALYRDQLSIYPLKEQLDKLWDTMLQRGPFNFGERENFWQPRVDLVEKPHNYIIYVDLPGVELKDIKISSNNNKIRIEGEKILENNKENTNYNQQERYYGRFYCEVSPLVKTEEDRISATLKNGVLKLEVPKKSGTETKYIEIKQE
jgi:HSP20 family protein